MSRLFQRAVLLSVFCLSGCSGSGSTQNWQEFNSEKCQFSALFPGDLEEEEVGTDSQFQARGKEANFRITCSRVSPVKARKAALRELLAMRDGAAKSLEATVIEAREADVQGEPAIEFKLAFSINGTDMVTHTRYVRCQDRFYQQIVTSPAETSVAEDTRKFFGSFKLATE